MNVSRRAANGEVDPNDKMNKSQIYITSAGFRDHFSYQKQIQLLVWQIVRPGTAFVMGGSWRTKELSLLLVIIIEEDFELLGHP